MKKTLLLISILLLFLLNIYWTDAIEEKIETKTEIKIEEKERKLVIPNDITWTDRFILTELKELRIWLEWVKREIYSEIQRNQLETVDKALSYSANTVNFFFVFITIIVMWFWVVWWRTVWDIKKSTKESMDRETKKIIFNFEEQIAELEKEQKVNIFWRQFNIAESDKEKMDLLDRIYSIKPESQYLTIERWNVYLSMWSYDKVLEVTEPIISGEITKHQPHALYNRACAYNWLWEMDKVISEITLLLQLAPEYRDIILESDHLELILNDSKIEELLK